MVVASITPVSSPESTSPSIDWPPVPVAWNTRQSCSSPSSAATACTQAVVTPNIVSPIAGLRFAMAAVRCDGVLARAIMPARA